MHFNGRFIMNLAQFAGMQGANAAELIKTTGLTVDALCQEDCKVGAEVYNSILEQAVELTADPYFGLHSGENMNLAAAGLIAQISHTSETVKQALEYCCQFANLGCSALPASLSEEANQYKLSLTPDPEWLRQSPVSVRHTVEGYFSFMIREFHSLTQNRHYPIAIHTTFDSPDNYDELSRVVNCPVRFGADEIAMLFDKHHVEQPVVTSDFALLQVLVSHAEAKQAELADEIGFYEMVKKSVINLVKPSFPSIDEVASHLNMSVRTFQRKLSEENHSFKALIDELRMEFALSYLKNQELSIAQIAYLLSYADASAFNRSFKRWTGKTPNNYRKK